MQDFFAGSIKLYKLVTNIPYTRTCTLYIKKFNTTSKRGSVLFA